MAWRSSNADAGAAADHPWGSHARRQTLGVEGTASTSEEMGSHQRLRCGLHVFAVKYFKLRFVHCFLRHNTIVASREAPIDYSAV